MENITRVNLVDKFNGLSELNFWTTDYANQIVGTGEGCRSVDDLYKALYFDINNMFILFELHINLFCILLDSFAGLVFRCS